MTEDICTGRVDRDDRDDIDVYVINYWAVDPDGRYMWLWNREDLA